MQEWLCSKVCKLVGDRTSVMRPRELCRELAWFEYETRSNKIAEHSRRGRLYRVRLYWVLHGESSKRLASPRNTKDKKHL